ncbi:hypothetical protein TrRE_jg10447 [Triparma retinervis]|uniref:Uncharacterized protein n=1 Tax=Triparma retinervis TaxID=2557542 RepID=A0A9W7DQ97_9STRA|nr:hypothetical protein TrRE_jg10447 [Triparma retinervis]
MAWDAEKTEKQNKLLNTDTPWLDPNVNFQHTASGDVFKSSPIAELLLLGVQKFSMRDPYGMGVEYEGGKPGWNDAMNRLVGMLGSGMPEAYELQLVLRQVERTVAKFGRDVEGIFRKAQLWLYTRRFVAKNPGCMLSSGMADSSIIATWAAFDDGGGAEQITMGDWTRADFGGGVGMSTAEKIGMCCGE